jgi:3'-phosphoadenosine 5'-phosphosulfate sulfotransferase (PAPS reductase)/FAD synthetase
MHSLLTDIFDRYRRVALWCSGGKDSLTLLHHCIPWRHKVIVIHNHVDDGWPDVTENLSQLLDRWGFLRSIYTEPGISFDQYTITFGWPVNVVPTTHDGVVQPSSPYRTSDLKLASWWHCTLTRQIQPLVTATASIGADCILTGSRNADGPAFAAMGQQIDAGLAMRYNPLAEWTSEQVYQYVDAHDIPLPPHYKWKRAIGYEAPDCMSCTWQPQYWAVLKRYYPKEFRRRWPQARKVFAELETASIRLEAALKELPPHGQ